MIDLQRESLVSLSEAAKRIPLPGAKPHLSTIWRWCRKGIGGVRLEYLRVGRRIVTSQEAMGRFFQAVAERDQLVDAQPEAPNSDPSRTFKQRERDIHHALHELEKAGI